MNKMSLFLGYNYKEKIFLNEYLKRSLVFWMKFLFGVIFFEKNKYILEIEDIFL